MPSCKQYVLSLPNNKIVKSVVDELYCKIDQKCVVIDTSTISPDLARECRKKLSLKKESKYIDAPVSGGVLGSQNGSLTFMLGLKDRNESSEQINSILESMGKKQVFCGEAGMGQSVKLVNNLALAIQMMSICETFAAGKLLGISP